jgi:hypothetical protein
VAGEVSERGMGRGIAMRLYIEWVGVYLGLGFARHLLMVELGFTGEGGGGVLLQRAFPGGVGKTEESTTLENNFSPHLLLLGGVLL